MNNVNFKVTTVEECQRLYDDGAALAVFYHHHENPFGVFSQWAYTPFEHSGMRFPTMEHFMMWQKAKRFGDEEMAKKIIWTENPEVVKRLGRQVKNFQQQVWDDCKEYLVATGNYCKFSQDPHLKRKLLETHDSIIVEASPFDKVWGAGLNADQVRRTEPRLYPGQNLLGRILMTVRGHLM